MTYIVIYLSPVNQSVSVSDQKCNHLQDHQDLCGKVEHKQRQHTAYRDNGKVRKASIIVTFPLSIITWELYSHRSYSQTIH